MDSITFLKSSTICQACRRTLKFHRSKQEGKGFFLIGDDRAFVNPNSIESWKAWRQAAEFTHHEGILGIQVNSPDEIPYRKCRGIFTLKRDLEKIISDKRKGLRKIRSCLLMAMVSKGHAQEVSRVLRGL